MLKDKSKHTPANLDMFYKRSIQKIEVLTATSEIRTVGYPSLAKN